MTYIDPRHKVLWHADRISELQLYGHTTAPVNVEIDLSNRCTHGCEWCHFAYTHSRGPLARTAQKPAGYEDCGDLMDTDLAFDIIDQLGDMGVRSITWTGGGEPTLHPAFKRIIDYAAMSGIPQGIYTHGSNLTGDLPVRLKASMTFVYISLDEATADKFYKSKGVNRFEYVVNGISDLAKEPGTATIGVGFLLHSGNVGDVERMVHLARSLGADYCQFRPVVDYVQDCPGTRLDTEWVDDAIAALAPWQADPFVNADLDRFLMYRNWAGHGYTTCNWAAMQTVITPNGKVWACVNRRGHKGAELGDLTVERFEDIWYRHGKPCNVGADCRLLCRGHLCNLTLDAVVTKPQHEAFI